MTSLLYCFVGCTFFRFIFKEVDNIEKLKEKRTRCFCAVLYEEMLQSTMNYVRAAVESGALEFYAIIQHEPDDECKSVHWHLLVYMKSPTTCVTMCNDFGVRQGIVQYCKNKYKYAAYLIHKNDKEKKQYNIDEVSSNDFEQLVEWIEKGSQELSEKEMLDLFHSMVYEGIPLHLIMRTLVNDGQICCNTIRKYTFYFRTFYSSFTSYEK